MVRFGLLALEDQEEQHRRRREQRGRLDSREERQREGLLTGISPETRRALVNMIDYQLSPILVDQWRYAQRAPFLKALTCPARVWPARQRRKPLGDHLLGLIQLTCAV